MTTAISDAPSRPTEPAARRSRPAAMPSRHRWHAPALDGVRGLAIVLVLMFHQNLLGKAGYNSGGLGLFNELTGLGWAGVNLFFVLSGFLITRILYRDQATPDYYGRFYFRRLVRIFPLYYAVLLVTLVILPQLPAAIVPPERLERFATGQVSSGWYWFYLSNFAMAAKGDWGHGILDVAWSLSIEEQFYMIWPLVVRWAGRRELMRLCGLLVGLALAIRVALTWVEVSPVSIYLLTPCQFDVIAAGAWLALALEKPGNSSEARRWGGRVWGLTGGLLLALFLWRGTSNMDPWVQTVGFSLVAIHFAALIGLVLHLPAGHWVTRFFCSPALRAFGKYSYAMYLFHLPVRGVVRDFLFGPAQFGRVLGSPLAGQLMFYALTTALTFGAALVSWHLFESHFLKLKDRWQSH